MPCGPKHSNAAAGVTPSARFVACPLRSIHGRSFVSPSAPENVGTVRIVS
jgi:hypothetical protein